MEAPEFMIVSLGLLHLVACSQLTAEETTQRVRSGEPCGTSSGWVLDEESHPEGTPPNPCPCNEFPETNKHFLFTC